MTDKWKIKIGYINTHTHTTVEHFIALRKEILKSTTTWMKLEDILNKVSKRRTNTG